MIRRLRCLLGHHEPFRLSGPSWSLIAAWPRDDLAAQQMITRRDPPAIVVHCCRHCSKVWWQPGTQADIPAPRYPVLKTYVEGERIVVAASRDIAFSKPPANVIVSNDNNLPHAGYSFFPSATNVSTGKEAQ